MSAPITQAAVEDWATALDQVHDRLAPHFARSEPRQRVRGYLAGLLSPIERKNGWQLAEQAGEPTPTGMQRVLSGTQWDADAVRDDLRAYVVEHLTDPTAVLIIDETGFLKKGAKSVGVKRQYSGTAGRIENCQIGVLLAYASRQGRTFLDRELYLPQEWAGDAGRRAEAGVPVEVVFQTKPQLATAMLARALDAGVPASWVTADEIYGGDRRLRLWLEERKQPFVLAIKQTEPLWVVTERGPAQRKAAAIATNLSDADWQRLSAGDGAKGPRLYDWMRVAIRPLREPGWDHWLLIRRSLSDPDDLAYYVCFAPVGTPLDALVRVAGTRWAIEECIETATGEVGLDQYEVRTWDGWYRHLTLALFAHAMLTVIRARVTEKGGQMERPDSFDRAGSTPTAVSAGLAGASASGADVGLV